MTQLYSTCKPLYVQLDRAVASYGVLKVVDTKYSRHFAYVLAQDQRFVWSKMIIHVPWTQIIANHFFNHNLKVL